MTAEPAAPRDRAFGRTVLVTGASAGIGRAACLLLVARGHTVYATARGQDALDRLAGDAAAARATGGGQLRTAPLDVRDEESRRRLRKRLADDGAAVDVLVNCAGIAVSGPLLDAPPAQVHDVFATNVFGLLALTQDLARPMIERGHGRIVNVSSTAGRFVGPMTGAYCASKFALEAMSDALRVELGPFGVDVVVVEPGAVRTGFAERSADAAVIDPDGPYAALIPRVAGLVARSQMGAASPERVADVVAHAAVTPRPRARYVTPIPARVAVLVTGLLPVRLTDRVMRRWAYLGKILRRRRRRTT